MSDTHATWEQFLTPSVAREKLISASLYITAFEILRESIVGRIRDFYVNEWNVDGPVVGKAYEVEVLARYRSTVYASLEWLVEHDALTKEDVDTFETLKRTRNALAHELHSHVMGVTELPHVGQFPNLVALLRKVETWWIVNVEIPTNPDYDGAEIDVDGIVPGPVLSIQMLLEVVSGSTELLEAYRRGAPRSKNEA